MLRAMKLDRTAHLLSPPRTASSLNLSYGCRVTPAGCGSLLFSAIGALGLGFVFFEMLWPSERPASGLFERLIRFQSSFLVFLLALPAGIGLMLTCRKMILEQREERRIAASESVEPQGP